MLMSSLMTIISMSIPSHTCAYMLSTISSRYFNLAVLLKLSLRSSAWARHLPIVADWILHSVYWLFSYFAHFAMDSVQSSFSGFGPPGPSRAEMTSQWRAPSTNSCKESRSSWFLSMATNIWYASSSANSLAPPWPRNLNMACNKNNYEPSLR